MQTEEYKNAELTISNVQIYEIDLSNLARLAVHIQHLQKALDPFLK